MNGQNIAGVAWKADLISARIGNDVIHTEATPVLRITEGIALAAGANSHLNDSRRIVAMAWRSDDHPAIAIELNYWHYERNRLLIAACGSWDLLPSDCVFPSSLPPVIAVTAVKENYDDVPGLRYGPSAELSFFVLQLSLGSTPSNVVTMDGSSGATSVVAGIAALTWSRYPTASRDWVRQRLRESGHAYPVRNNSYGYGVVNAREAVGGIRKAFVTGPTCATMYESSVYLMGGAVGDGPFSFYWSNGATTPNITVSPAPPGQALHLTLGVTDLVDGTQKVANHYVTTSNNPSEFICPTT